MSIETAKRAILGELVADFRTRQLGKAELQSEYIGPPMGTLEQAVVAVGISKVDYELAVEELEGDDSIGTGPSDMTEAVNTPDIFIFPMIYSKREYAYLREKGYKAALKNGPQRPSRPSTVVHGDHIVNYGQAGAIGRNAVGTINYQQQWAANQADLSQVLGELQTLKAELLKTAKTADDYSKVAAVTEAAEHAEKHDGPKVMEALSKSGKWMLEFATKVGTDITAKLIASQIGLGD